MFTLILDTSTDSAFIAIAENGRVVAQNHFPSREGGSRHLLAMTRELMGLEGLSFSDLKAIGCAVGPGSFTGIRVAAAFAMGLSPFGSPPLIPFSSFAPLIDPLMRDGRFVSIIFAKVGGCYALLREKKGEEILDIEPASFYTMEGLEDLLCKADYAVSTTLPQSQLNKPLLQVQPSSAFVAKIVESSYARGQFSQTLDLVYLRACPSLT